MRQPADRWDQTREYINRVFGEQEPALAGVMPRAVASGLPDIAVDASVGRMLLLLCRTTNAGRGARLAIELGTLAGYSAVWIARGLSRDPGSLLITIEPEPRHADFAARTLRDAGVGDKVEILRGRALEELPRLRRELGEESIDFAFVDAVKTEYPAYFDALAPMIRPGGLFVADNVLGSSWWITDPPGSTPERDAVDRFNRTVAADRRFETACVPLREGLLVARRQD